MSVGYNAIAERYVAIWNEPDPRLRRKLIDELWAPDAIYYNRLFAAGGADGVDMTVTTAHDEYFAKGLSFRSRGDAYGHHNGMRFGWVLVVTATGEVDTFGEEFLILGDDGRIRLDYQFGLRPPAI